MNPIELLDVHQVAAILRCNHRHVRRLIAEQGLPTLRRASRKTLIPADALHRWIQNNTTTNTTNTTIVSYNIIPARPARTYQPPEPDPDTFSDGTPRPGGWT